MPAYQDLGFAYQSSGFAYQDGGEPEQSVAGGHYWPDERKRKKPKDHRAELDAKRQQDRQELRDLINRAAGLIDAAAEQAQEPGEPVALETQATALNVELGKLREYAEELDRDPERDLAAIQERVDGLLVRAADDIVVQIADTLTELIQEMFAEEVGRVLKDLIHEIRADADD